MVFKYTRCPTRETLMVFDDPPPQKKLSPAQKEEQEKKMKEWFAWYNKIKKENKKMSEELMPIMYGYNTKVEPEYPSWFPMNLLNEDWATTIHSQTLKTLASRGGLCPQEVVGNIKKLSYNEIAGMSLLDALEQMKELSTK